MPILVVTAGCTGATPPAEAPVGLTQPQRVSTAATSDTASAAATPLPYEDESIADLKEHDRHHHHGGFAMFVAMSLDSLGAALVPASAASTLDQREAITKIQADMRAEMRPAHEAEKTVLLALADGIAGGGIDKGAVDGAIAHLSRAAIGVDEAVAGSLNELHAVLNPAQRAALVDKVEAHFEVWNSVNSMDEWVGPDRPGGQVGRLTTELGLSTNQVDTIRGTLKSSSDGLEFDRKEGDARLLAFRRAFLRDTFDARTLAASASANAHIATWGAVRMARVYEAVLPALTRDQRTKLADAVRRNANYTQTGS